MLVLVVAASTGSAASGLGSQLGPQLGSARTAKHVCAAQILHRANCGALVVADSAGSPLAGGAPPAGALSPAQFHSAYNLPTTGSGGATLAIVDAFDDPSGEADLAAYNAAFNLPACTTANGCFRKVNQTGGTNYPPSTQAGRSRSPSTSRSHTPSARTARSCSSRRARHSSAISARR